MRHFQVLLIIPVLIFFSSTLFAQGNCNEADQIWLLDNQEFAQTVAIDCGISCLGASDSEVCMQECMGEQTPLSTSCITCFSQQVDCTLANCLFQCIGGASQACEDCLQEFCADDFILCVGIVDEDNDGFNNIDDCDDNDDTINPDAVEIWYDGVDQNCDGLNDFDQDMDGDLSVDFGGTDCNDTDATVQGGMVMLYPDDDADGYGSPWTFIESCDPIAGMVANSDDCDDDRNDVYPGAPGTGEGIDNNCNGIVEGDESFSCPGDFDNNLIVNAADLLFLLSNFGCEMDCEADLAGGPDVSTDDLLVFLSVFGVTCF